MCVSDVTRTSFTPKSATRASVTSACSIPDALSSPVISTSITVYLVICTVRSQASDPRALRSEIACLLIFALSRKPFG